MPLEFPSSLFFFLHFLFVKRNLSFSTPSLLFFRFTDSLIDLLCIFHFSDALFFSSHSVSFLVSQDEDRRKEKMLYTFSKSTKKSWNREEVKETICMKDVTSKGKWTLFKLFPLFCFITSTQLLLSTTFLWLLLFKYLSVSRLKWKLKNNNNRKWVELRKKRKKKTHGMYKK